MAEICNECGKSVAPGSGRFVNRVIDANDPETRKQMGKPYPEGDFICPECWEDESIGKPLYYNPDGTTPTWCG